MPHRRPALPAVAHVVVHAALGLGLAAGLAGPTLLRGQQTAEAGAPTGAPALAAQPADDVLTGTPTGTAPDPRLAAEDVVGIVLGALAQASPDVAAADERPIALAYAFASPANRASVGTLEHFAELVRDEAYRPLLGHRQVTRGAVRVLGDRATQRVVVTAADGERVAYTFTLARQAGGSYRGCWMTERVRREAPSRVAAGYAA